MRMSDWSSDVCSSDLQRVSLELRTVIRDYEGCLGVFDYPGSFLTMQFVVDGCNLRADPPCRVNGDQVFAAIEHEQGYTVDRKSVASGRSVYVGVDLGGVRIIKREILIKEKIAK